MKKLLLIAILLGGTLFSQAQSAAGATLQGLVRDGIKYHDAGNYEMAIDKYKEALKIEPKSELVNYEIALSYFSNGDYKKAIKHCDVVIKAKGDHLVEAYNVKGSALDLNGQTEEAVKVMEKAIKSTDGNYLLYFNLALNYTKLGNLEKAEEHSRNALKMNPSHTSSHFLLASIHAEWGHKAQSSMAAYMFLLLEPNSKRSPTIYKILMKNLNSNVEMDPDKPNTINLTVSEGDDPQMAAAEVMLTVLKATESLEENKDLSKEELFQNNTTSYFKFLGEVEVDEKSEEQIWWKIYAPFLSTIGESDHMEAYCHYICQSGNENSATWLTENETKMDAFADWMKNQ